MTNIHETYAVIVNDRAAASACLLLAAPPSRPWGAPRRSQRAEKQFGRPVMITRRSQSAVDLPATKISKFQSVPGSIVWRPPV